MHPNEYLASKPRYEILDGLRGVAAMIVVAYHLFEVYAANPAQTRLNHGYLAVDFFFVLSGFVVGYAYDDRWRRMSLTGFFKRRLTRLHPMLVMGTLIGALLFYFGDYSLAPLIGETPWWKLLLITLFACTALPALTSWDIRGWVEMNPLNGPAWSLIWEYFANALYALFIRHFSKTMLTLFVLLSALLTIDLTMNIDIFGIFSENRNMPYTVVGGWSLTSQQLYIGLTRLLYPFFIGLLLSRLQWTISLKGGFWWCGAAIAALLIMPRVGGEQAWMNGLYEAVCILALFPLIVAAGAGSRITGKKSVAACRFLGEISYPLYITHYPLIYMQFAWKEAHPDAPVGEIITQSIAVFILSVGIAYAVLKLYDRPLREWLKRHWLMKQH